MRKEHNTRNDDEFRSSGVTTLAQARFVSRVVRGAFGGGRDCGRMQTRHGNHGHGGRSRWALVASVVARDARDWLSGGLLLNIRETQLGVEAGGNGHLMGAALLLLPCGPDVVDLLLLFRGWLFDGDGLLPEAEGALPRRELLQVTFQSCHLEPGIKLSAFLGNEELTSPPRARQFHARAKQLRIIAAAGFPERMGARTRHGRKR